jgi:hypothetical protein
VAPGGRVGVFGVSAYRRAKVAAPSRCEIQRAPKRCLGEFAVRRVGVGREERTRENGSTENGEKVGACKVGLSP